MRREELQRFFDVHGQDIAHGPAPPLDLQRLAVEALAATALARNLDVRQKAHFDGAGTGALAIRATSAAGIEREAPGVIAAHARLAGAGEYASDVIPESNVCSRAGAGSAANRRLIDFKHARDAFGTAQCLDTDQWRRRLRPYHRAQVTVEHVARQRRLARSGNSGHHNQPAERNANAQIAQVVNSGGFDLQGRRARIGATARNCRMLQRTGEETPGQRLRIALERPRCSAGYDLTAAHTSAGT